MNENSIVPFIKATNRDLVEAGGITRIDNVNGTEWNQIINGLILQGGKSNEIALDAFQAITFSVVYPNKVLGIFVQALYVAGPLQDNSGLVDPASITTQGFNLYNDGPSAKAFFWWAIGI